MFSCKVCVERDKRIFDLKQELDRVHALLKSYVTPTYNPAINAELNNALDGAGTVQIELTTEQKEEMHQAERQAIELLTGTY